MATTTQPRISVGTSVRFPHHCIRWSRCDGTGTGTVTQLTDGGMWTRGGDRFAHVLAPCGAFAVCHTADLREV